jgi:hypothetical protein
MAQPAGVVRVEVGEHDEAHDRARTDLAGLTRGPAAAPLVSPELGARLRLASGSR